MSIVVINGKEVEVTKAVIDDTGQIDRGVIFQKNLVGKLLFSLLRIGAVHKLRNTLRGKGG